MLNTLGLATGLLMASALSATAFSGDHSPMRKPVGEMTYGTSPMLPPPGYASQWWTSPNKCDYSRAGRPGEIVWFLIINTAHRGCKPYLVQQGFKDAY
jgi:hypothetical protein